jgi:chemotaxis protein MotB
MARRKKHAEHANHERWLVSYADFITLLFAFFVVMFSASNSDHKKAGQIAQAVQVAFSELAVFTPSGKVVPMDNQGGLPSANQSVLGSTTSAFSETQLIQIKKQLEETLKEELHTNAVRITADPRGVVVSLAEAGFFDPGSAVVKPTGLPALQRITEKLSQVPQGLRVEGHTDNTPIHTPQFPSNWELSTARATYVLQYLIGNGRISPNRLSAVGYGEYRPTAPNNTVEGRAANRRVDLVILGPAAERLEPASK